MAKKSFEIRKELGEKTDRFEELRIKDQRSAEEQTEFDNLRGTIRTLTNDLDDAELTEAGKKRLASQGLSNQEREQAGNYSFRKAIYDFATRQGKLEGFEAEMHQEAVREAKETGNTIKGIGVPMMVLENARMTRASAGQNKTTANDGGNLVQEEPLVYIDALRNRLVLVQLGARFITGLVGNLPLVNGGSFTATWAAEAGAVSATKMSVPKKTMSPKRMAVCGAYSVELLNQSSIGIEMLLRSELLKAHANGIEIAAINSATNGPTGVINTSGIGAVAGGDNGLAPAWSHLVDLETQVAIDNADLGALAYLTNAKVRGKLKQTLKASGVAGYIWDGNTINGYNAAVTNAVPSNLTKGTSDSVCSAIIFGNWNDMIIGQWGGYDMIVDPYSLKKVGDVEVVLNSFHDVALANVESFAAMKDALTA
jgi:HK97 family phage major capsid protein